MNELALFAGAGGGILGGKLLGWKTVCAVEWDAYARDVLVARQNDGCLDPFPIWDDVQTFDGTPWRGRVDVVSGGFPCQDISAAGKGAGIDGERSGMWGSMARIIGEVLPRFVWVENSPLLVGRGLARVLGDLAAMGYDARWGVVGAIHAGAPHKRERIWIVAKSSSAGTGDIRREVGNEDGRTSGQHLQALRQGDGKNGANRPDAASESEATLADPGGKRCERGELSRALRDERDREEAHGSTSQRGEIPGPDDPCEFCGYPSDHDALGIYGCPNCHGEGLDDFCDTASEGLQNGKPGPMGQPGTLTEFKRPDWWAVEPELGRVANGVACRVDRLRCLGNGQVPAVVPLAWNFLR